MTHKEEIEKIFKRKLEKLFKEGKIQGYNMSGDNSNGIYISIRPTQGVKEINIDTITT